MKKFFGEFKKFITRGNVIDLAVGMIIGAAFTAIVNALVNSIFKPLINTIPMGDLNGLITMLVPKDANGVHRLGRVHHGGNKLHTHGVYLVPDNQSDKLFPRRRGKIKGRGNKQGAQSRA